MANAVRIGHLSGLTNGRPKVFSAIDVLHTVPAGEKHRVIVIANFIGTAGGNVSFYMGTTANAVTIENCAAKTNRRVFNQIVEAGTADEAVSVSGAQGDAYIGGEYHFFAD